MEVSGQLHAPVPTGSRPGCALEAVWILWSTEAILVAACPHTGSINDDDDDGSCYYYFNFPLGLPRRGSFFTD
jgi:hypothetical protein